MNKEEAARILPFIQALADGKTIQWRFPEESGEDAEWTDTDIGALFYEEAEFRIKPDTRWYRVGLMENIVHEIFPFAVATEAAEGRYGGDPDFKGWLTPRIEYEV